MSEWPDHPRRVSFQELVGGKASREEARTAVRHLLAGCPVCIRLAEEARSGVSRTPARTYDEVFDRIERRLTDEVRKREGEKATARQLYAELLGHEAVEALLQVQSTRRYASLALCELLLKKSQSLRKDDTDRSQTAAELAQAVAEQLDFGLYGSPVVQDLQASTWAYVAQAGQTQADLRAAESSYRMAERLLEPMAGGPPTPPAAELLTLQASLASYTGRFEDAARLLNRAASFYRQTGDLHRFGRTLIKKGAVLGNAGELESATRLLRRGIDLIDGAHEPRLMVCPVHNLIWFLHESGREDQAAACLDGARRLYQRAGDRRDLGRLRWLEGKLARRLEDAERPLREAREGLAREGLSYEAALASMDLAMRYAAEQRGNEMRRYADGMLPLFRSGDMYHETVQALLSFQKQDAELGTEGFLDEMGAYIRRIIAEKNPPGLLPAAAAPS